MKTAIIKFCFLSFFLSVMLSICMAAGTPSKGSDEASKPEGPFKPFAEVTKDTQKFEGLFTFYQTKEGQVYLEIPPGRLDSLYQITMHLSRGIGEAGLLAGVPLDDYLFEFHRVNNEIQFVRKNTYFTADPDSPLGRSVKQNFTDSILGSLKILSIHPDKKSILVETGDLFLSDLPNLSRTISLALKGHYSVESAKSSVKKIEAFPLNVEVEVESDFATSAAPKEAAFLDTLPDWRNIPLGVHFSFSKLPSEAFVPRVADDRIGYFTTDMKDFSSQEIDSPVVRYIYRWNMSKKPIVFWIENSTPLEYRDAIKEGILEWNKAFGKLGIDQAVDAKIQPDDSSWSSSDIRYNVIHWLTPSESKFAGLGPSHVNPLTGEIYNASVLIDSESVRSLKMIFRYEIGLGEQYDLEPSNSLYPGPLRKSICTLPALKARDARVGILALALASLDPETYHVPESFIHDYLKDLVMHEVGHCLGLRHNFHASTLLSLDELQEPEITGKTGLSASVMDYLPVNLSAPGQKQGDYFSKTIGTYDYWAIEYGYTPTQAKTPGQEKEMLSKIASFSNVRGHAYATDEDSYSPFAIDPHALTFDLSNDSLGFVSNRFLLYQSLFRKIAMKLPTRGQSFSQMRRAFDMVFSGYSNYSEIPIRYIGGQFFNRNHRGDLNAKSPLSLVPESEQMRALQLLDKGIFSGESFSFSPVTLNKLAPERNTDHFSDLQPFLTHFDYPILEKVSNLQKKIVGNLFRPILLNRMVEDERKVSSPVLTLTLPDYFEWMTVHFWEETVHANLISDTRRALQRTHLGQLVRLMLQPKPQMFGVIELEIPPMPIASVPDEAKNLAQYQLTQIRSRIIHALKSQRRLDVETTTHLESCLRFIDKAFKSKLIQAMPDGSSSSSEEE